MRSESEQFEQEVDPNSESNNLTQIAEERRLYSGCNENQRFYLAKNAGSHSELSIEESAILYAEIYAADLDLQLFVMSAADGWPE